MPERRTERDGLALAALLVFAFAAGASTGWTLARQGMISMLRPWRGFASELASRLAEELRTR